METVVFEDSPLAQYLEGQGSGDGQLKDRNKNQASSSPAQMTSFAPFASACKALKSRKERPSPLKLEVAAPKAAVTRVHERCSSIVHRSLGWTKSQNFLEQFRYIIVASQLLNEHSNRASYNRVPLPLAPTDGITDLHGRQSPFVPSTKGLILTALTAFAFAFFVRWFWFTLLPTAPLSGVFALLASSASLIILSHLYIRRQQQQNFQQLAVDSASRLTTSMQEFDNATTTSIAMIQEVELLSRGYNINPMPPVPQSLVNNESSRCVRLRRAVRLALNSLFQPYFEAYKELMIYANQLDLEKYSEIYEISRLDVEEVETSAILADENPAMNEALHELKIDIFKTQTLRKMLLCTLLALEYESGTPNLQKWSVVNTVMMKLVALTADTVTQVSEAVVNEEAFPAPLSPQIPLTPARERTRGRIKVFSNLSQGIRSLQAKMRFLGEEADRFFGEADESSESNDKLMHTFDAIGTDLKDLVHEWERGRAALISQRDRHFGYASPSKNRLSIPLSPASSLGGATAVEGSPSDALRALNGGRRSSSRSSVHSSTSEEQILEAVGEPRQRSMLNREQRLAQMKEDRMKQAYEREKAQANTHMLKELEMVVKMRPRGRTTGRMTSV